MYDNYQWGKMAERARARACSQIPEEGKKMMMMPDFLPPADDKFEPCVFLAPREIIAEENSVEEAGLRISEFFVRSCFISLRTIHTHWLWPGGCISRLAFSATRRVLAKSA